MPESHSKSRELAETAFARSQRWEAEIDNALKLEAARHVAVIKNMHRLRELRLAHNEKQRVSYEGK